MAEIDVACENCGEEWENTSDGYLCCQKKIAKLEKQITTLRAQLAEAQKKGEDLCCVYGNSLVEIHDLKAQLAVHGGHTADCAIEVLGLLEDRFDAECDCGWAEIAAGFDKAKEEHD